MIDKNFCEAVVATTSRIKKEREERDACPREMGGCGARGALHSVSQRGITSGKFCGQCGWSTFFLDKQKGRAKVKAKPARARRKVS